MKSLVFSLCLANVFLHLSCGPEREIKEIQKASQEPIDALLYYSSDEWPISCYFYDPSGKDFALNLPLWNQAWVWAKTSEGAHIHAQGKKEGGYVIAKAIYYSKGKKVGSHYIDTWGTELMPEIKTTDDMEKECQRSIDEYHPDKGYQLIGMVASRNTKTVTNLLDNAFPLVVGESTNPNVITRMVIFGDSLSDTGRLKKWTQVMPGMPYFEGHFSNGGTWSDFLARQANVTVLNYSVGGAVTKSNITSSVKQILDYVTDVGRYFVTGSLDNFIKDYINNELTNERIPRPEKTLFVIWGGANDFMSRFDRKKDVNNLIDNPDGLGVGSNYITDQTVINITYDVKNLIALGAKNILVANIPDIGKTPRMGDDNNYGENTPEDKYNFSKAISGIIKSYNRKLASKITEIQEDKPNVKIILFDAEVALNNIMEGRGPHGEANFDYGLDIDASFTTIPGPHGKPDIKIGKKCYLGGYLGSKNERDMCKNPKDMLFMDEVHPTATGHCGLAFLFHQTLYKHELVSVPPDFDTYRSVCAK